MKCEHVGISSQIGPSGGEVELCDIESEATLDSLSQKLDMLAETLDARLGALTSAICKFPSRGFSVKEDVKDNVDALEGNEVAKNSDDNTIVSSVVGPKSGLEDEVVQKVKTEVIEEVSGAQGVILEQFQHLLNESTDRLVKSFRHDLRLSNQDLDESLAR